MGLFRIVVNWFIFINVFEVIVVLKLMYIYRDRF